MEISGDEIADVVLRQFDAWESKRKPLKRTNGVREWVPLSGIVAQSNCSPSWPTNPALTVELRAGQQGLYVFSNGVSNSL